MKRSLGVLALTLALLHPAKASASIITFHNRTAFNQQGTIAFNSNFNDFGTGLALVAFDVPYTRGDVTYIAPGGLFAWGADTHLTDTETLVGNGDFYDMRMMPAVAPHYNMFGFDVGVYGPGHVD